MPYLALHDRLRQVLRQPNVVIFSCGYSFRDEHLNEIVQEGLQRNPSAVFYGFLYGKLDRYDKASVLSMETATANLVLFAEDQAVIGCEKAGWRKFEDVDENRDLPGVRVSNQSAFCDLGDFAKFGEMLASLTGGAP
jgi:hypothetical protein